MKKTGLIILIFIFVCIINVSAQKDVLIDVKIIPKGIISKDYNVVGDAFTYKVSIFNNDSDTFEDNFSIELYNPNGRIEWGSEKEQKFTEELGPYDIVELIPYINQSENNDTKIWPFDISGDYKLKLSTESRNLRFIKQYNQGQVYFPRDYESYFDVMPLWQYNLFKEESDAANKVFESNRKLIDLTIDLESATDIIKIASIIMMGVAIMTLYIAALEEKDRKGKLYKLIKFLSKLGVIGLIIYLIFLLWNWWT